MCYVDYGPSERFEKRVQRALDYLAPDFKPTIVDPVLLLNSKHLAAVNKLIYSRGNAPGDSEIELERQIGPGPYLTLRLYERCLGRPLERRCTHLPAFYGVVARTVVDDYDERRKKL